MRDALLALLRANGGVVTREQALAVVAPHVLKDAVRSRAVVRVAPRVYGAAALADDREARWRAALAYCPAGALSHIDALAAWGLAGGEWLPERVHVTVPAGHHQRRHAGIVLHRSAAFRDVRGSHLLRGWIRVVSLEQSLLDSWSLLPEVDRRVPVITAFRERRTTARRVGAVVAANPRATGRAELMRVARLAAQGIHSPLELWGHEGVFTDPSLPPARLQVPVDLPSGRVYLDRYYDEEMVAAELDGAAYHGSPGQRQRDIARDSALAAMGVLTVRFSHPRLFREPELARAELAQVLAVRRRQLRR